MHPDAHCGSCGAPFAADATWPRRCARCGQTTYRNPIPVAVVLLPVAAGLLVVRRAIDPGCGQWALPGGFLEVGEPWREGAARELVEETGIVIPASSLAIVEVHSTADTRLLLLFCAAKGPPLAALPSFRPNPEVSELAVLEAPRELAFPLHTAVSGRFLAGLRGR
ncbi:MAG: NUDIX domain-containing protein [Nannocystaceae bacterium]